MLKILKISFAIFGVIILLFASLQTLAVASVVNAPAPSATLIPTSSAPISLASLPNIDDLPLQDNPNVYQYDDPGSVVTMYLTVRKGNISDNSAYTWDQVNSFTKVFTTGNPPVVGKADAILQIGDDKGPVPGQLGYGVTVPNATVQIRGFTTSLAPQKGYKIELLSGMGTWRGQSTINLNKHPYDDTRFKNKLNFDLLKQIPNITSLRTQFVHLYVKDETTSPWSPGFVDYGLFTQIEQPNRRFLKNHLLDPDAQLYKATFFEFLRYPDVIRTKDDPLYDPIAFSKILEIKGNEDHSKLIQMLDDLNNYDIPIEQTFAKYFDSENYFTWLAYNILVLNNDTQSQNFYLYSPHNSNKWYFLPWDYDGTFLLTNHPEFGQFVYAPWARGISNYWGVVLPNRLLRQPEYRQVLDEKINELKDFLTPDRIKSMIDVYQKAVEPYVSSLPDSKNLGAPDFRAKEIELLPQDVETNYQNYVDSLKHPMPFFLNTTKLDGGQLFFSWGEAYDFKGQDITYHFVLSKDLDFKKIEADIQLVNGLEYQMLTLKPGIYYWKVTAENTAGMTQIPFDTYMDAHGVNHYGIKQLTITSDGQVQEQ